MMCFSNFSFREGKAVPQSRVVGNYCLYQYIRSAFRAALSLSLSLSLFTSASRPLFIHMMTHTVLSSCASGLGGPPPLSLSPASPSL